MKKLISILLTAVMCSSSVAVFAEHQGPTEIKTQKDLSKDVIVSDIYEGGRREEQGEIFYIPGANDVTEDAKFLMDIGVIDHYHPDSALQRNVLKKLFEVLYGSADVFYDYFSGEGSEKQTLTFDEALVVLMNMTGYSFFAESKGGNKSDYMLVASEYDFLKNVDINSAQTKLTAKHFCKMAYNALNADMVKNTPGTYGMTHQIVNGQSVLKHYLKLTKIEGVVRANSYTSIIGVEGVGEGHVMVGDQTYPVEISSDVDAFLGYYVNAYIDKDNNIRAIMADDKKNSFIEFGNETEVLPSTSKQVLAYYDKNYRRKTLKVDKYADLIYNHILYPGYTSDFYVIGNGTLKLIDNNGDGVYDVVFRYEYTSFLPLTKNEYSGTVTDRNSVVYDIKDVLDGKYRGVHAENGEVREFKDFTNTTGISVLTQKDTNKVTELIILNKKTYEGTYQSAKESGTEYVIGEKTLEMAQVYRISSANKFPFALGSNVLVYLDMFDRIIFAESTTSSYKYAWLIKMYKDEDGENTVFKLFTQDNVVSIYQLASKISYNNVTTPELNLFSKTEIFDSGATVSQLIKYKINKDGYINGIQIADKTTNCGFGAKKAQGDDSFQMNLNFWDENKTIKYYGEDLGGFSGKYYIDVDKTLVFGIPTSTAIANEGEENAYRLITTFELTKSYKINMYDVDHEYRIGAATMEVSESASKWVNKGYGSHMAISGGYEWDPDNEEVIRTLHEVSVGGTWSANLKDTEDGYYGGQLPQDHWDYKNLFAYAYPETKKLSNNPSKSVRDRIKEEYAKFTNIADIKPGTIFKYTTLNTNVAFYNIEFMIIPDMPIRDHFFEFGWNDSADDVAYTDMYDSAGNLINEYAFDNKRTGITKDKFYGGEIIAFGQVTEKFIDGFLFNAHVGEADQSEWDRRVRALPTKFMRVYYYNSNIAEESTVAELQAGDYIFLNMIKGKLQGIVVFRDLPNV